MNGGRGGQARTESRRAPGLRRLARTRLASAIPAIAVTLGVEGEVHFLIGLLMPDHPHARRWVDFGMKNLKWQVENDSFSGGAWKESIGYSGAFFLVADYLRMAREAGFGNAFRDWPRIREVLQWFACMETPVDPRCGTRQKAPLGDTSVGDYASRLNAVADDYRGVDELFSEQLRRFPEKWERAMDLGSREFPAFGAMMRGNAYDDRRESFVTVKAGLAREIREEEGAYVFTGQLGVDLAVHVLSPARSAGAVKRPNLFHCRLATGANAWRIGLAESARPEKRDVQVAPAARRALQ